MPSESGSDELCSVQGAKSNTSWEGQGRKGAGSSSLAVFILLLEFLYFWKNPHAYFILLLEFYTFHVKVLKFLKESIKKYINI